MVNNVISKKEYIENYAPLNLKNNIKADAIGGYICGGLSLIVAVLVSKSVFNTVEALIVIALAVGVHLYVSNLCAYALFAIGIVEYAAKCYYTHSYTPNLIFLVGGFATFNLIKATKMYKAYLKETQNQ